MSGSFCPHCQADWARPWYDVCPSCGHRFKDRPWTESAWLAFWIMSAPAFAVLGVGILPASVFTGALLHDRQNLLIILAVAGSVCASIPSGILFARRVRPTTGMRVLLSLVTIPLVAAVSFCLCFFACAGVLNR